MPFDHDTLTGFAKSFGLFYLIALSLVVIAYAYWPGNRQRFDEAARRILDEEADKPCP